MFKIRATRALSAAAFGCAAAALLALAPAALATTVTVRVQGPTRTLLPTTAVHLKSGSITRGGAPSGDCPAESAQGALSQATGGDWQGSWYSSYHEYYITGIRGLKEAGKHYYWALYVNNRFAKAGACEEVLKTGASVVFAVVPTKGSTEQLLGLITPVARVGSPYRVRVVAYGATGKAQPLAGATVLVDGRSIATGRSGWTPAITFPAAGKRTLSVAKAHYVGTEATIDVAGR
jgi:hypothetical protein